MTSLKFPPPLPGYGTGLHKLCAAKTEEFASVQAFESFATPFYLHSERIGKETHDHQILFYIIACMHFELNYQRRRRRHKRILIERKEFYFTDAPQETMRHTFIHFGGGKLDTVL